MKKIIAILALFVAFSIKAQVTPSWPSGAMSVSSVTNTTKVTGYTITPVQTAYYLNITVDTSLVITIPSTIKVKAGALLYVKVINGATGATRTITGSTGCTMQSFTMTSAKSHLCTFIYDGTNYVNVSKFLVN